MAAPGDDIYGSPDHQAFRETVRRFVQSELVPRAREFDRLGRIDKALYRRMGELGLLGIRYDPAYGGQGLDYSYHAVFLEELASATTPAWRWGSRCTPTWRRPRSTASAARSSNAATSCPRSAASRWRRSPSPSRPPAPTSLASRRAPCATATSG